MEAKKKYIYVTYDPLYEEVICAHEKPNSDCKVCRKREYQKRNVYQLCQKKLVLKP
jgi:hypothetical protein